MAAAKRKGAPPASTSQRRAVRAKRSEANAKLHRQETKALATAATQTLQARLGFELDQVVDAGKRPTVDEFVKSKRNLEEFEKCVSLGISLVKLAQRPDFPTTFPLAKAASNEDTVLGQIYARARQNRVAILEEEIEEIARNPHAGIVYTRGQRVTKDGDIVDVVEERESDSLQARMFLVDTLKWQLGWLRPKRHGRHAQPDDDADNGLKDLLAQFKQRSAELEQ